MLIKSVSDSFNRADGSVGTADTGQTWTNQTTTAWAIASNAVRTNTGTGQGSLVIDSTVADCVISVDQSSGALSGGLCWRVTGAVDYFLTYPGNIAVYRLQGGTYTSVSALSAIGAGTWTVVINGNSHTVYLNGSQVAAFTDSFNNTATKHGLTTVGANEAETWDNFSVTVPALSRSLRLPNAVTRAYLY